MGREVRHAVISVQQGSGRSFAPSQQIRGHACTKREEQEAKMHASPPVSH